ncbi:hypothetical protein [Kineosporia succinea]|uniref:FG-GAP repeat protein n=1 Tax=Kineosporia succinea TaxID=84632 RepID=A0ABT9P0G1_9ACTN|nr:hypothetical protein [Kineosporia succinea]MDP9826163.1 hypothetical protein [Kineosporia succinea]
MLSTRAARPGRRRALPALALVPATLLALAACGSAEPTAVTDATAGPAGVASATASGAAGDSGSDDPATSAPDTTRSSASTTGSSSGGSGPACESDGSKVPSDAGMAKAGDLDGDGKNDQIWLADDGDDRLLGVKTASGAVFHTTFSSASPQAATAVGNRLGDGSAIILLSTGRSAPLYAVIDCKIVPTKNKDGNQYSFDLGFGGYGTGVACPAVKGALYLAGYDTDEASSGEYTVTRTRIDLADGGASAANGTRSELGDHAQGSATYEIATGVSCGDMPKAAEPES